MRSKTDIPNNKFYKHDFVYKPVKNADCNITGISTAWHGVPVNRFNVIQGGSACAVMSQGYALPYDDQVNFWYGQGNRPYMDGHFHISGSDYEYRCQVQWDDGRQGDSDTGIAQLYICKATVPLPGSWSWKWHDAIHTPKLHVIDLYGNKGTVEIIMNCNNFAEPCLR